MSSRFWFYSAVFIIIAGLGSYQLANARQLENEINRRDLAAITETREALDVYLDKQKDSRKLVTLAQMYAKTQPALVEPVVLRAFELNQESRDIAILASPYSQAARERIKILDPLYVPGGNGQSGQ